MRGAMAAVQAVHLHHFSEYRCIETLSTGTGAVSIALSMLTYTSEKSRRRYLLNDKNSRLARRVEYLMVGRPGLPPKSESRIAWPWTHP